MASTIGNRYSHLNKASFSGGNKKPFKKEWFCRAIAFVSPKCLCKPKRN